jgi:RNA polymerase sigma-70 factor, ECF subfamily
MERGIRAGRLRNPTSLASFVLGTCRHVARDTRRAEQRQLALERAAAGPADTAEILALEQRDVVRLFGCMSRLPGREAAVIRMTFWEDRPAEEIAASLGASAGHVRVIRHRALNKLAQCMQKEGA